MRKPHDTKLQSSRYPLLAIALALACFAPQGVNAQSAPSAPSTDAVTYERLLKASDEPENWLMYSGQYNGQRFSRLDQINRENVTDLKVAWVRQFSTSDELFETSPIVNDGVLYGTLPRNKTWALDAKTGLPYWTFDYPLEKTLSLCCGQVNRGFAALGDTLFMGTLDAHLVAMDAKTGRVLWDVEVADSETGYSITNAPLVVKDMVITGIGGGEYGIQGFIAAYDAKTGEERWKRIVIPGPGEFGNDTWEGDSWKYGGASTWLTGSFDPELNLIYWGVGNPGPDWNGDDREGDNLYSDCALALDADTGEIKWHFQFTPHDVWDWDACQIPVLADLEIDGKPRKLMLWANRNAFYYVLDRVTGEFITAQPYSRQTWADAMDDKGRPTVRTEAMPTKAGTDVYPELKGGTNWYSPSYSPQTNLFYVNAYDGKGTYYLGDDEYVPGRIFLGGIATTNEFEEKPDPDLISAIRALDPVTGDRKWEYRMQPKSTSGVLSTAGGLVFAGTVRGNFFALDAETGDELWRLDIGGRVHSAPVSFEVDGTQYISVAAGNALYAFKLSE